MTVAPRIWKSPLPPPSGAWLQLQQCIQNRLHADLGARRGQRWFFEIGCGVGWHPIRYAEEHPHDWVVAVERTHEKSASFLQRLERHQNQGRATQVIGAQGDGWAWGIHGFPEQFLEGIWIFYPNPLAKGSGDHQHFLRNAAFGELMSKVRPGGQIVMASNLDAYLTDAMELGRRIWGIEGHRQEVRAGDWGADGLVVPRTHFEKKYLERGETCWEVVWQIAEK